MKLTQALLCLLAVATVAVQAAPAPSSPSAGVSVGADVGSISAKVSASTQAGTAAPKSDSGDSLEDAAKKKGIDLKKAPISFGRFSKALTAAGLPEPSMDIFFNFLRSVIGPTGKYIVGPLEIGWILTKAIVKGFFGIVPDVGRVVSGMVSGDEAGSSTAAAASTASADEVDDAMMQSIFEKVNKVLSDPSA
ncbi:hypothetical protein GQ42DRAFT_152162 [Ramicandelaber brevisporus]|nr:hypothetical protein GQ42DRAFT_152162 [Ramicandelaber brevisporus]